MQRGRGTRLEGNECWPKTFFLSARLMHSSFSRAKHFLLSMIPAAIVWNHDLGIFFFL